VKKIKLICAVALTTAILASSASADDVKITCPTVSAVQTALNNTLQMNGLDTGSEFSAPDGQSLITGGGIYVGNSEIGTTVSTYSGSGTPIDIAKGDTVVVLAPSVIRGDNSENFIAVGRFSTTERAAGHLAVGCGFKAYQIIKNPPSPSGPDAKYVVIGFSVGTPLHQEFSYSIVRNSIKYTNYVASLNPDIRDIAKTKISGTLRPSN